MGEAAAKLIGKGSLPSPRLPRQEHYSCPLNLFEKVFFAKFAWESSAAASVECIHCLIHFSLLDQRNRASRFRIHASAGARRGRHPETQVVGVSLGVEEGELDDTSLPCLETDRLERVGFHIDPIEIEVNACGIAPLQALPDTGQASADFLPYSTRTSTSPAVSCKETSVTRQSDLMPRS